MTGSRFSPATWTSAINNPVWGLFKAPWKKASLTAAARAEDRRTDAAECRKDSRPRPAVPRAGISGDAGAQARRWRVCRPPTKSQEIDDWTKSWEYREKNLAREALTVNPAKACQPLGAVFVAAGFEKTLSFVHGSQGCVAYYRSHLSRHFKEPCAAVSSSMTEDAAVFGGLQNMIDGLANAYTLYSPKMIAVSTTCMAEVIGDDLQAFISTAKQKGSVPEDFDVPFAHTPAFVGSHTTGYDNMLKGILEHFWKDKERTAEHRDQHDPRLRRLMRSATTAS